MRCVEVGMAIGGIRRRKAPGPDGVPGWAVAAVSRELSGVGWSDLYGLPAVRAIPEDLEGGAASSLYSG